MLDKGKKYIVDIVDIGENGVGIGKYDGFTVFVDNALIYDKVKVKIIKSKKSYAVGSIISIIEESPFRVKSLCSSFDNLCGGCQILSLDYNKQLEMKTNHVREVIKRIGKLDNIKVHDTIGMENPYMYRNKAQFPVSMIGDDVSIGFYKKKSHDVVLADNCVIQHRVNSKVIEVVKKYIEDFGISVYDEKSHTGILRHIVTKIGFTTGEVMVVLVVNADSIYRDDILIERLKESVNGFSTFVLNINREKTNVILGSENKVLYGSGKIVDYIGDLKFEISPLSFFQVNPVQTNVLYGKALEYASLSCEENVFDIYCGIGSISLFLAKKAKKVYGIEVVEDAISDARINASINGISNVDFYVGKAEDVVEELYSEVFSADVVVVDPPRKGCDERVLDTIVKMRPKRVVYVSCNPSTLARDLGYLSEFGFVCEEIQPVDMFPHTMHVECVALIEKK